MTIVAQVIKNKAVQSILQFHQMRLYLKQLKLCS
jgi:hypothetical protein